MAEADTFTFTIDNQIKGLFGTCWKITLTGDYIVKAPLGCNKLLSLMITHKYTFLDYHSSLKEH